MSTQASTAEIEQSVHDLETQAGAEHVSMGSSEPDITSAVELNNVRSHFKISNRMRGTQFSYVLYDEGYLKVRKRKG